MSSLSILWQNTNESHWADHRPYLHHADSTKTLVPFSQPCLCTCSRLCQLSHQTCVGRLTFYETGRCDEGLPLLNSDEVVVEALGDFVLALTSALWLPYKRVDLVSATYVVASAKGLRVLGARLGESQKDDINQDVEGKSTDPVDWLCPANSCSLMIVSEVEKWDNDAKGYATYLLLSAKLHRCESSLDEEGFG